MGVLFEEVGDVNVLPLGEIGRGLDDAVFRVERAAAGEEDGAGGEGDVEVSEFAGIEGEVLALDALERFVAQGEAGGRCLFGRLGYLWGRWVLVVG